MKPAHLITAACVTLFAVSHANAAVTLFSSGSSSATFGYIADFEDVSGSMNGVAYGAPNPLVSGGVHFAERFLGQTNTPVEYVNDPAGHFDVLSGVPVSGHQLALDFGSPGQDLAVFEVSGNQKMAGVGVEGMQASGIGEGSFAALFSDDQPEIEFQLLDGEGGKAWVSFFSRNGGSLGTFELTLSSLIYTVKNDSSSGGIAGFSVYNRDPNGIALDNVRYNVRGGSGQIPEPGSLALAGLALIGLVAARRRMD